MSAPSVAVDIVLRPAARADLDAIARIMNEPPEPPSAVLMGARPASRLGTLFVRAGISITLPQTTVATLDGRVAGVMECGRQDPSKLTPARALRLVPVAMRGVAIVGVTRVPRVLRGFYRRSRVSFDRVPDAFPIAELYVDEGVRNRGIGGRLLAHAEELARSRGMRRLCLETGIGNPARRLYERNGYRVVAAKTDAVYERLTGSPGRVLMIKELDAGD